MVSSSSFAYIAWPSVPEVIRHSIPPIARVSRKLDVETDVVINFVRLVRLGPAYSISEYLDIFP